MEYISKVTLDDTTYKIKDEEARDLISGITTDANYVHNQLASASVWTITHNLNKHPNITIVDSGGTVVIGEYKYIDLNTVECTFSGAFSGKAYLN